MKILHKQGFYEKYVKRPQDILFALVALVVLSPVIAAVALLVRLKLGSPVIFRQERSGLNGTIFTMYKFRTMSDKRNGAGKLLPDEDRMTNFGKKLRSTSLDELPELFNVLKGDMSLVGPRPLLVQYLPLYNETQARRHEVRPGMTGYAQVNGRNDLTWEEKFEKDVYYVDHLTAWGDFKILAGTVRTVVKREGISSGTAATMEAFQGGVQETLAAVGAKEKIKEWRKTQDMKKLYIVGSGGFGREILWLVRRINEAAEAKGTPPPWEIAGFIDDDASLCGRILDGYPVLGDCTYLGGRTEEVYLVIAIGSAKTKRAVAEKLSQYPNVHFANLIDPSVTMSDRIQMGEGCMICAGTAMTVDITIGNHVIINLDCTLGHDSVIEDYVTVYPSVNISGNVTIGEEAELGTGTQIIQGKKIGKQSVIGAGAIVVTDIPEKCTAVGSPARPISSQK